VREKVMIFIKLFLINTYIASSIPPLASLVKEIAGNKYEVVYIVSGFQNPHTYEIKPSDISKVVNAELYFEIGGHLEGWGSKLCSLHKNCVNLCGKLKDKGIEVENPHIWLDLKLIPECAKIIEEEMKKTFPEDSSLFKANLEVFTHNLSSMVESLKVEFSELKGTKAVLYHPSWNGFLEAFGIQVAGSLVHHGEKEISAGEYVRWIQRIKNEGVSLVISDINIPSKIPENLAKESGVCFVNLNPLFEGPFIESLEGQALLIRGAMKCRK